jgi:hypothetical protein
MFHACVERFDVMGVRGNILGWDGEEQGRRFDHDLAAVTALGHGAATCVRVMY